MCRGPAVWETSCRGATGRKSKSLGLILQGGGTVWLAGRDEHSYITELLVVCASDTVWHVAPILRGLGYCNMMMIGPKKANRPRMSCKNDCAVPDGYNTLVAHTRPILMGSADTACDVHPACHHCSGAYASQDTRITAAADTLRNKHPAATRHKWSSQVPMRRPLQMRYAAESCTRFDSGPQPVRRLPPHGSPAGSWRWPCPG